MDYKLINEFTDLLVPEKFHIKNLAPKIFLCGGVLDDNPKEFCSIRDYVFYKIREESPELAKQIVLAEELTQWISDNHYNNLLDLEEDLAGLVSGIAIFVESAGSLAELGAFSAIPEIRKKVLVFLDEPHAEKENFIWLGPLQKIDDDNKKIYNFSLKKEGEIYTEKDLEDKVGFIIEEIESHCKSTGFNKDFKIEKISHLILLICDLVNLLVVCKKKDISEFLTKLGILLTDTDINLKKCLWMAERIGLLKSVTCGEKFYYAPLDTKHNYIEFSYKDKTNPKFQDRSRWRARFIEQIKKDTRYKAAYKEVGKNE